MLLLFQFFQYEWKISRISASTPLINPEKVTNSTGAFPVFFYLPFLYVGETIENAGNEESESVESDSDESETDQSSSDESDTKEAEIFRADTDIDDLNEKGESKVQKEVSEIKSGNKEVEVSAVVEKIVSYLITV